jgi:hypothetical protein
MNSFLVNEVNGKGGRRTQYGLAPGNPPFLYNIYLYKFIRVLIFVREFFFFKNSSMGSILSHRKLFSLCRCRSHKNDDKSHKNDDKSHKNDDKSHKNDDIGHNKTTKGHKKTLLMNKLCVLLSKNKKGYGNTPKFLNQ